MPGLSETAGFGLPIIEKKLAYSRHAGVHVMATIALAICLVIAATAVSIGMARAQVLPGAVGWHGIAAATRLLQSRT